MGGRKEGVPGEGIAGRDEAMKGEAAQMRDG